MLACREEAGHLQHGLPDSQQDVVVRMVACMEDLPGRGAFEALQATSSLCLDRIEVRELVQPGPSEHVKRASWPLEVRVVQRRHRDGREVQQGGVSLAAQLIGTETLVRTGLLAVRQEQVLHREGMGKPRQSPTGFSMDAAGHGRPPSPTLHAHPSVTHDANDLGLTVSCKGRQ